MKRKFSDVEVDSGEAEDGEGDGGTGKEEDGTEGAWPTPRTRKISSLFRGRWVHDTDIGVISQAFLNRLILITTLMILGCGILLLMEPIQTMQELGHIVGREWVSCPDTVPNLLTGLILLLIVILTVVGIEMKRRGFLRTVIALCAVSEFLLLTSFLLTRRHHQTDLLSNKNGGGSTEGIIKIQREFGCCNTDERTTKLGEDLDPSCCWRAGSYYRQGQTGACQNGMGLVHPFGCKELVERFLRATVLSTWATIIYASGMLGLLMGYCGLFLFLHRRSSSGLEKRFWTWLGMRGGIPGIPR